MAEFTPMMRHYLDTKEQYKDCILFYRLGDFYEMFFDDALTASKVLEHDPDGEGLRTGGAGAHVRCALPRGGLVSEPAGAARATRWPSREQMEDPKLAKGLVKREVVRVVTPGTITSAQALDETKNNYHHGHCISGWIAMGCPLADISLPVNISW